jgi:hypothetical protein
VKHARSTLVFAALFVALSFAQQAMVAARAEAAGVPAGDHTTDTEIAIWNGLGGFGTKSGAILNCTLAGGKPCWSVKALAQCSVKPVKNCMTLGRAAEFIIENQSKQISSSSTAFTDFKPAVTMAGTATNTHDETTSISSDPDVNVLTDFTHTTTHVLVSLAGQDDTDFSVEATQSSFPLYCHGPLMTTGAPGALTEFKWAAKGADAQAPGEGECAWADRGPRGSEIKPGDTNTIWGYLNQLTNLPEGKYGEIEVYRDPNHDNDLVLTQIIGFVSPPF